MKYRVPVHVRSVQCTCQEAIEGVEFGLTRKYSNSCGIEQIQSKSLSEDHSPAR